MADNEIMNEIEAEIKKAKGEVEDFEIEVIDDPVQEAREEAVDVSEEKGDDYGGSLPQQKLLRLKQIPNDPTRHPKSQKAGRKQTKRKQPRIFNK